MLRIITLGDTVLTGKLDGQSVLEAAGQFAQVGPDTPLLAAPLDVTPANALRRARQVLALYTFQEGAGDTVRDLAGHPAPLDLAILDRQAVAWLPGGGLALLRPTRLQSRRPADRLNAPCQATQSLTVELWVKPAPAQPSGIQYPHIITLVPSSTLANFTIGFVPAPTDGGPAYKASLRTRLRERGMEERLSLAPGVAPELTHVVYVRPAGRPGRFYLNGQDRTRAGAADTAPVYDFSNWAPELYLVLGNEITDIFPWLGEYHLAAVYASALNATDVTLLYRAGPPAGRPPDRAASGRQRDAP